LVELNKAFHTTGTICGVLTLAKNHMSLAVLRSRALAGMDVPAVTVEVHLANGLHSFTMHKCTNGGRFDFDVATYHIGGGGGKPRWKIQLAAKLTAGGRTTAASQNSERAPRPGRAHLDDNFVTKSKAPPAYQEGPARDIPQHDPEIDVTRTAADVQPVVLVGSEGPSNRGGRSGGMG
jgi:magnesium chelatase family protein